MFAYIFDRLVVVEYLGKQRQDERECEQIQDKRNEHDRFLIHYFLSYFNTVYNKMNNFINKLKFE